MLNGKLCLEKSKEMYWGILMYEFCCTDDREWHGGAGTAVWLAHRVWSTDRPVRGQRDSRAQDQLTARELPGALGETCTADGDS